MKLTRDQLLSIIFEEIFDFNKSAPYEEIVALTESEDIFEAVNVKPVEDTGGKFYAVKFQHRELGIFYVGMSYETMKMYA